MIQPGQKLKEGDWCEVTTESAKVLFEIEGFISYEFYIQKCVENGICFNENELFVADEPEDKKTEHTFPDFRQLCENTFGV